MSPCCRLTAYVDNVIQAWRQGAYNHEIKGFYANQAIRRENCEAHGAFSFVNLPVGKWYVEAAVITSPLFYGIIIPSTPGEDVDPNHGNHRGKGVDCHAHERTSFKKRDISTS